MLCRAGEVDWGSEFSTTSADVAIEKVIYHDRVSFTITPTNVDKYQDHLRVSTKADTLTSKPQQPNLPFLSASELRRFLSIFPNLLDSTPTSGVDSS